MFLFDYWENRVENENLKFWFLLLSKQTLYIALKQSIRPLSIFGEFYEVGSKNSVLSGFKAINWT